VGEKQGMVLVKVGFGNLVAAARVIAVVSPDSSPVKRLVADARDRGSLIDATSGRKTRAVLVMDSDHVVLSSLAVEDLEKGLSDGGAA
jgi:extracellular matrix regulatory protein A